MKKNMYYKILTQLSVASVLSIGMIAETAGSGMFDWMTPNKWFNNRDYDRDYNRGYGYGYQNYGYPGWGGYGGYPGWGGYPGMGYPGWGYPAYSYPIVQPQQNNSSTTQAAPPTPQ